MQSASDLPVYYQEIVDLSKHIARQPSGRIVVIVNHCLGVEPYLVTVLPMTGDNPDVPFLYTHIPGKLGATRFHFYPLNNERPVIIVNLAGLLP